MQAATGYANTREGAHLSHRHPWVHDQLHGPITE